MGVMDRRFSRAPIPMKGDRCALVAVRQRTTSVYDRPASVFRDEGGPTPAFSGAAGRRVNWHGWRHGTRHKNRAQPRGRTSGVRCKAMLGRLRMWLYAARVKARHFLRSVLSHQYAETMRYTHVQESAVRSIPFVLHGWRMV